jgi:hypothetical protein
MSDKIPAEHFVKTLAANADNSNLDDKAFREFVRNTLPIVEGSQYTKGKGFKKQLGHDHYETQR